jgi:hypothetical protein
MEMRSRVRVREGVEVTNQHTPGPWKANGTMLTPAGAILISARDGYGADVAYVPDEANARLIAESPAMLEALEATTQALETALKYIAKGNADGAFDGCAFSGQLAHKKLSQRRESARDIIERVKGEPK